MGTIQVGLDQVDAEQECDRTEKRICECCAGRGWLEGLSIHDPKIRECEYCDGRGWWPVLPVPGHYA